MVGQVEIRYALVGSVHAQHELDEVVGADREKIRFLGEIVDQLHHGGQLDHHAQLGFIVVFDSPLGEPL